MNIKLKHYRPKDAHSLPVEDYIDRQISQSTAEGRLEEVSAELMLTQHALARLVGVLTNRGLLSAREIVHIAQDYDPEAELTP